MISVGITGGIGSGKTTVCNIWKELGAYVLNADDLAKQIMVEDEEVVTRIKETFGTEAYTRDGRLNRKYLAEEAFEKERVKELNDIVHPKIPQKSFEIRESVREQGIELFVYEAALLFENLRPNFLDYIVLVLADRQKRIERVQKRDGVAEQKIRERMNHQQNFEQFKEKADVVIYNNGTLLELKVRAKQVYNGLVNSDSWMI